MSQVLKPCPARTVNGDGQILCSLVKGNDCEISLDICQTCPVSQINCQHLRASLFKQDGVSLTVRFVTGRTEVWNNQAPAVSFQRAACAEKAMPIESPRDCTGCPIRMPQVIPQGVIHTAREYLQKQAPIAANSSVKPSPVINAPIVTSAQKPAPVMQVATHSTAPVQTKKKKTAVFAKPVVSTPAPEPTRKQTNSKIIQIEKWLVGQFQKKKGIEIENPDIVQDIPTRAMRTNSRTASIQPMAEEVEKCVGWTD